MLSSFNIFLFIFIIYSGYSENKALLLEKNKTLEFASFINSIKTIDTDIEHKVKIKNQKSKEVNFIHIKIKKPEYLYLEEKSKGKHIEIIRNKDVAVFSDLISSQTTYIPQEQILKIDNNFKFNIPENSKIYLKLKDNLYEYCYNQNQNYFCLILNSDKLNYENIKGIFIKDKDAVETFLFRNLTINSEIQDSVFEIKDYRLKDKND